MAKKSLSIPEVAQALTEGIVKDCTAPECAVSENPVCLKTQEIVSASKSLVLKLIELEQDANFRSVVAVAQINGMALKGNLWIDQARPLAKLLDELDALKAEKK